MVLLLLVALFALLCVVGGIIGTVLSLARRSSPRVALSVVGVFGVFFLIASCGAIIAAPTTEPERASERIPAAQETTAAPAETTEEPKPTPKPKPKPEPDPDPKPKAAPDPKPKPKPKPEPTPAPEPEEEDERYDARVTVTRVVDGDTVEISPTVDGNDSVRLIGMDTPETVDPGEEVEPYGPEASAYVVSRLEGIEVDLEFDEERLDQYDRLLAYVYTIDGEMVNEDLVEEGLAQSYPYPPNTRYEDRFAAAQDAAAIAGLGIWGLAQADSCLLADRGNGIGEGSPGCVVEAEPPVPVPGVDDEPVTDPSIPAPSAPSGGDLDCADFGSLAEVQQSLAAGDPHGLDGDGDGEACESNF